MEGRPAPSSAWGREGLWPWEGWGGWGPAHQCLHVIHGAQVVPDDLGGDLPPDVLAEFVSDTDHVEVPVHTCRRKGSACGEGRASR